MSEMDWQGRLSEPLHPLRCGLPWGNGICHRAAVYLVVVEVRPPFGLTPNTEPESMVLAACEDHRDRLAGGVVAEPS